MKEIHHYHITLDAINKEQLISISKLIKAKSTSVDLLTKDENISRQRMLTKYFINDNDDSNESLIILKQNNINILRLKKEKVLTENEFINFKFNNKTKYLELHIKVLSNNLPNIDGFLISKTSDINDNRFYNARAYNNQELDLIKSNYKKIINGANKVLQIQFEECYYDSNLDLDANWK